MRQCDGGGEWTAVVQRVHVRWEEGAAPRRERSGGACVCECLSKRAQFTEAALRVVSHHGREE